MEKQKYVVIENFNAEDKDSIKEFVQKKVNQHIRNKIKNN